jgi:hypothetical protein
VEWLGWLLLEHVLRMVAGADEFFFPCPRRARAVLGEAHAVGLPVVCLARGHLSERDQMEPM